MDYDKTEMPKTYAEGRNLAPAVLQLWMDAVAAHVDAGRVRNILDLGCGTGRFSGALARRFDADVFGIDPSIKMLREAPRNQDRSRVFYACGSAEALPMDANSVDVIFISMAFHHFTDPMMAARECRRVMRNRGRLCLRTATQDKIPRYPYVPYFPGSRVLLEQRLPSLRAQCETFKATSFKIVFCGDVVQQIASDYREYAEKLALRADSILVSLKDEEFEAGIAAICREKTKGPIVEPIDFAVFEKVG
jgi:ubiquinone/menaquinone biosynthesis C-methylase UbiE